MLFILGLTCCLPFYGIFRTISDLINKITKKRKKDMAESTPNKRYETETVAVIDSSPLCERFNVFKDSTHEFVDLNKTSKKHNTPEIWKEISVIKKRLDKVERIPGVKFLLKMMK